MRARPIRFSPSALHDIDEILDYVSERNAEAAWALHRRFHKRITLLGTRPFASRPRDEIAPGLRSVLVAPYVIFIRILPDSVIVLRVIHGARDLTHLATE